MFVQRQQFSMARARYHSVDLSSRIEGASPHRLVMILFEELLKSIDAMAVAQRNGDIAQRSTRQGRALSILTALDGSLDHAKGGEIARGLASIYGEARRLLMESARNNDAEKLADARAMLAEIASAWEVIGTKQH